VEALEDRLSPAVITVNGVDDAVAPDTELTLREAILVANGTRALTSLSAAERAQIVGSVTAPTNIIKFNIGNAPQTINLVTAALPTITRTLVIDGTAPAGKANQTIELKGVNNVVTIPAFYSGLTFSGAGADGSWVYGLTIDNFGKDGISLSNVQNVQVGAADSATITGGRMIIYQNLFNGVHITGARSSSDLVYASYIGTDASSHATVGGKSLGNGANGVLVEGGGSENIGANSSTIDPNEGNQVQQGVNVISNNQGAGIRISGSNSNLICGNLIGTKENGTAPLANSGNGVEIVGNSSSNKIGNGATMSGGTISQPANVISGNGVNGVLISAASGTSNMLNWLMGNLIGTDIYGAAKIANTTNGVEISSSTGNMVGFRGTGQLNVISGNTKSGVYLHGGKAQNNVIQKNLIGLAQDGSTDLANGEYGVDWGGTQKNQACDNKTAKNTKGAYGNNDKGNAINDPNLTWNNGYGIGNGTMFGTPVITSASTSGGNYSIAGTLASTPSTTFSLEFFGEVTAERQGAYYLGTTTVTTDSFGNATFSVTVTPTDPFSGDFLTATSTDTVAGWTSEFSYDYSLSGANLPARPSLGSPVTVNPGSTFSQGGSFTASSSSSWTATVDYGDGSGPQTLTLNSDKTFTLSHSYATSGAYEVVVAITDGGGAIGSADLPVTVAGPVVAAESDTGGPLTQGDTFVGDGAFADPTGTSWTGTVNYGDGSGSQSLTLNSDGTFALGHTYTTNGSYNITVNVTDNNSVVGSVTVPVQVLQAVPAVTLGSDTTIHTGATFAQSGGFGDPYSSSWTATVDYGDGGGAQSLTLNSDHTFSLSHTYSTAGTYLVSVAVTGNSGAVGYGAQYVGVFDAPVVSGVSPSSGPTGGSTGVTLSGTNLTEATAVYFGSTAATSFTANADGTLTAVAPSGSAGTVDITVTTAGGTSATSSADHFTYLPAPVVTGISPSSGSTAGGTSVNIGGSGFTGATAVYFGATAATSFTVHSDNWITAIAPAEAAGTVDITVTTTGGASAASSADRFTFLAPPTVTGVSPSSGSTSGGTFVTITGTNFTGATAVYFGTSTGYSFTVVSSTEITVYAPPHAAGLVDITVITGGGTSATSSSDDYTYF